MPDHSPAPWTFDGPPDNIHVRQDRDPEMRVCFMTSNGPTVANARLIAAAPDLLAALRAVVAICDRKTDEFDAAKAAISKATGK